MRAQVLLTKLTMMTLSVLFLLSFTALAQSSSQNLCLSIDGHDEKVATLTWQVLSSGNVKVTLTAEKTFNDNTYGTNIIGWSQHKFDHLRKSDKAEFSLRNQTGAEVLHFELDYFDDNESPTQISGYGTRIESGNSPFILNHNSSLSINFNQFNYALTVNSPATNSNYDPNPTYPNWIYEMVYEFEISAAAFGNSGFKKVELVSWHNSPNKPGLSNATYPYPCEDDPCFSKIGNFVWHDLASATYPYTPNGIQDSNEPGIAGVEVQLLSGSAVVASTVTDANGYYEFAGLENGTYTVKIASSNFNGSGVFAGSASEKWYATYKDAGNDTKDSDGDRTSYTASVSIDCADNFDVDFGFFKTCVTIEKTAPATAQAGDEITYTIKVTNCGDVPLMGGAKVYDSMLGLNGSGDGYKTPVNPGEVWTISKNYLTKEADCEQPLVNNARVVGSPSDGGRTQFTPVEMSDTWTVDVACTPKSSLGDKVWYDSNKDGVQDNGEAGLAGVTVKLFDCNNVLKGTTITSSTGAYLFSNLIAGDYYVLFSLPAGHSFSPQDAGTNDAVDSDVDGSGKTVCTTLDPGENDLSWDAGIYKCLSTIGNFVWHDKAVVNGLQDLNEPGIEGVEVQLLSGSAVVASTVTDASGYYEFVDIENGSYTVEIAPSNFSGTGVFVSSASEKWYATYKDAGNDTKDSDGDRTSYTASVSIDCADNFDVDFGFFKTCVSLEKTGPESVEAGEEITFTFKVTNCGDIPLKSGVEVYDPMFNSSGGNIAYTSPVNPGQTWTFTKKYLTSDADCGQLVNTAKVIGYPQDGTTQFPTVESEDSWTVEVICIPKASLGNRVWLDENGNGIQEIGEPGAADVQAILFTCAGELVATTATDASGLYLFSDLAPGDYYVEFVLLWGYQFTIKDAGSDDALDSDVQFVPSSGTGITTCVTLADGDENLTVDAGLKPEIVKPILSITKSASELHPEDGEVVVYTITVANTGSVLAENIQVSDLLPEGVVYSSYSTSQGSFTNTTGLWEVGSLAVGQSATLSITVTVNIGTLAADPIDLGAASDFNVFIFEDVNQPSADTEAKMAAGGNVTLANYSVGYDLRNSTSVQDVLVVGGHLEYTSGGVYGGNVVYGISSNLSGYYPLVTIHNGSVRQGNPVDFAAARSYLEGLSASLALRAANQTTSLEWGGLYMTGTDPYLNIFEVSASSLANSHSLTIDVPNGSAVLVNISGTVLDKWSGGLAVNGTHHTNVLFNFFEATDLVIQGIGVTGTVLAPYADVNFVSGIQIGQMIAKSLRGTGQFNNSQFIGNIPGNVCITNTASIVSPDGTQGSSSVTIHIESDETSGSGGTGNGGGTGGSGSDGTSWEQYGSFLSGKVVWSFASNSNGNLLAGTLGGEIFEKVNDTWVRINESGMSGVGFIWSIEVIGDDIFVGTERGIYISSDNGSSWNVLALNDKDVRAVKVIGETLYAGTWGYGIFASRLSDLSSWTQIAGSETMAVHDLEESNGNLIAATFGNGVQKVVNNNLSSMNLDYPFVWTLGVKDDGTIYAGTYGNGVYKYDGSWNRMEEGLSALHIYSISVDNDDNVYLCSWASGIFVNRSVQSSGPGNGSTTDNWEPMGMSSFGISVLMVDKVNNVVYAGTNNGKVFAAGNGVTSLNESLVEKPTKYELFQNYPNPFNPSTVIKFSVVKGGFYTLKIYNIVGEEIATLVSQNLDNGSYEFKWDASNLTSGIYIYRLSGADVDFTKKMMLVK
ncbi:MAG: choice-of-anchor A family protein [Bacteroidetes bacterium]|nr:choice-of-anchor A family protein [Bacteroidota bacterium]